MSMKKPTKTKDFVKESEKIREVYSDNFIEEIKNLSETLQKYKYVAFDTEFPGVVFPQQQNSKEAYYMSIKNNVDKLKLIQIGITLTDENGNSQDDKKTWQFNLQFDLKKDLYAMDSISLLTHSGINFDVLESRGISAAAFGEYLVTSGLILNEDLHWVSFHGIYDFAYLLRIVSNLPLPDKEYQFFENLLIYFPNFYDIRYLVRFIDNFRGSLAKLGHELNIMRHGAQHQAGSDALFTSEIFFKLKREYLNADAVLSDKNVLFGLGVGSEEEFSSFLSNNYSTQYKRSSSGLANNFPQQQPQIEYPVFQNVIGAQYGFMRQQQQTPNQAYFNMNGFYPYNYQMGMQYQNTSGNGNAEDPARKPI